MKRVTIDLTGDDVPRRAVARSCPTCTLLCDDASRNVCELCGAQLPVVAEQHAAERACSQCTLICTTGAAACELCEGSIVTTEALQDGRLKKRRTLQPAPLQPPARLEVADSVRAPWRHTGRKELNPKHPCWQDELGPGGRIDVLGADPNDPRDCQQYPEGFTWTCCRRTGDKLECGNYQMPCKCSPFTAHQWRPCSTQDDTDCRAKGSSRRCNVCGAWEMDTCPRRNGPHAWSFSRARRAGEHSDEYERKAVKCDACHQQLTPECEVESRPRNPFKKQREHEGELELRDGWEDDFYEYEEDVAVHAPPNPQDNPDFYVWSCCGEPGDAPLCASISGVDSDEEDEW